MSELKCCRLCGAFFTCTNKGECCPECDYFDPEEVICLAPESEKKQKIEQKRPQMPKEVDPETFLFEDDDEEDENFFDSEFKLENEDEPNKLFDSSNEDFDDW